MKSLDIQEVTTCQPSGRDVVCPSATPSEGQKLNNYSPEEVLQVGLILFDSLCQEIGSSDKLYLAFSFAKDRLEKTSLDKKKINELFRRYVVLAETSRNRNPMVQSGFI
jgi:hypothetical protein